MTQCPQCGLKFPDAAECPNCNHRGAPTRSGSGENIVRNYFLTVKAILLAPSGFFRKMPLKGGLAQPLAFALVTHWLGSVFGYFWGALTGSAFEKLASRYVQFSGQGTDVDSAARFTQWFEMQQRATKIFWSWFWGAGSILLDPFKTLVTIFVTSAFVYVAARLFVNSDRQREVDYESAVRVVSYGMTPAILAAFPFVGGFISGIYAAVVTIIGAREAYRTSNARATLIVLFPELLFIGIIALGIMLIVFAALKFAVSVF